MILVDSSALIEYYRPAGSAAVRAAVAEAIAADLVATTGVVQVEILAFASHPTAFRKLAADFEVFHWLEVSRKSTSWPASLAFRCASMALRFRLRI